MTQAEQADDLALRTLLSVSREIAPELPEDLLRRAFALQRANQFEADRDLSLQALQRLLDDFVGQSVKGTE